MRGDISRVGGKIAFTTFILRSTYKLSKFKMSVRGCQMKTEISLFSRACLYRLFCVSTLNRKYSFFTWGLRYSFFTWDLHIDCVLPAVEFSSRPINHDYLCLIQKLLAFGKFASVRLVALQRIFLSLLIYTLYGICFP